MGDAAYNVRPFADSLELGRHAEAQARQWLAGRGWQTWDTSADLPPHRLGGGWWIHQCSNAGPRLMQRLGAWVVAPDLLCHRAGVWRWVEVKRKLQGMQYNRTHRAYVTGICEDKYEHYQRCERLTGFETWILFQHHPNPHDDLAPAGWHLNSLQELACIGGPPCQETRKGMPRLRYWWGVGLRAI